MFKKFLAQNKNSIILIVGLLLIWGIILFINHDQTSKLLAHPQVGQVYIFQEGEKFAPMRLDSISENKRYMRNYAYLFADAIPPKEMILANEFDLQFFAIYEKSELDRLYETGKLVHIYP
jgi:hypothetical protein